MRLSTKAAYACKRAHSSSISVNFCYLSATCNSAYSADIKHYMKTSPLVTFNTASFALVLWGNFYKYWIPWNHYIITMGINILTGWGSNCSHCYSVTGIIQFLAKAVINYKTWLQPAISQSSMEAKFYVTSARC